MSHRRRIITVLAITAAGLFTAGCGADSTPPAQNIQAADQTPNQPSTSSTGSTVEGETTVTREMDHRITESGTSHTIRCDAGGDIDIRADDVTLTLSGDCEELEIDGSRATVTSENLSDLDIQGDSNSVSASEVRELSVEGSTNNVTMNSVTEIDVEGADNTVSYETGDPRVEDEGMNTTINAA